MEPALRDLYYYQHCDFLPIRILLCYPQLALQRMIFHRKIICYFQITNPQRSPIYSNCLFKILWQWKFQFNLIFPNLTVKTTRMKKKSFLFHFLLYLCKSIITAVSQCQKLLVISVFNGTFCEIWSSANHTAAGLSVLYSLPDFHHLKWSVAYFFVLYWQHFHSSHFSSTLLC